MNLCKSILIAEDNDDIRETLEETLKSEGYVVESAKNGKLALEMLAKLPTPSLVLLDLMMPVMNGWEFLDAQKKDARFAAHQVVVISAVSPTASIQDPTPLATAGALSKPLSIEPLLQKVQELCGRPTVSDQVQ